MLAPLFVFQFWCQCPVFNIFATRWRFEQLMSSPSRHCSPISPYIKNWQPPPLRRPLGEPNFRSVSWPCCEGLTRTHLVCWRVVFIHGKVLQYFGMILGVSQAWDETHLCWEESRKCLSTSPKVGERPCKRRTSQATSPEHELYDMFSEWLNMSLVSHSNRLGCC